MRQRTGQWKLTIDRSCIPSIDFNLSLKVYAIRNMMRKSRHRGFPLIMAGCSSAAVGTGALIRLSPAALNKLLEIEAANLLEQGGDIAGLLQCLLRTGISAAAKATITACLANAAAAQQQQ
jgi:hypothetical protein